MGWWADEKTFTILPYRWQRQYVSQQVRQLRYLQALITNSILMVEEMKGQVQSKKCVIPPHWQCLVPNYREQANFKHTPPVWGLLFYLVGWVLTRQTDRQINNWKIKCLKHILGLQKENDVWRRTNKELLEVYEEQSVVNIGKFHDLSGQAVRLVWWKTDHPGLPGESSFLVSSPSWTKEKMKEQNWPRASKSSEPPPKKNRPSAKRQGKGVNHESNRGSVMS